MRKVMSGNYKFWQMTEDEIEFYLEGRRETQRLAQERQDQIENERNAMYGADDVEARASTSSAEHADEKHSTGSPAFSPVEVPARLPNDAEVHHVTGTAARVHHHIPHILKIQARRHSRRPGFALSFYTLCTMFHTTSSGATATLRALRGACCA